MPLVDDLMVADLYRANFRYPIARRPTARRLDVDHDLILFRIEAVIDPAGFRANASVSRLSQACELIPADDVAFGFDLHERDGAVLSSMRSGNPLRMSRKFWHNERTIVAIPSPLVSDSSSHSASTSTRSQAKMPFGRPQNPQRRIKVAPCTGAGIRCRGR